MDGVPLGEIVATVDGETGGVEPVVAIEGVDLEGFNHPAEALAVLRDEAGLNPRGVVGLSASWVSTLPEEHGRGYLTVNP